MGRQIDYPAAEAVLAETFALAEADFSSGARVHVPDELGAATSTLLNSDTQAFREALIGCALAHILDPRVDIRLPYMNQGDDAFNGRTLDERVVNPFLQAREIPCSKAPYLSALRRNISFFPDTEKGLRDKEAYRAMLVFIEHLRNTDEAGSRLFLRYLLVGFVWLRDQANVTLRRIHRLSVEQYDQLLSGLLQTPSGGLLPVLLAVATFQTIRDCFGLDWEIDWQGINVSDRASGVGGDISIRRAGNLVLAVEITERPIDRSRVVSTFNSKISPHGIDDYLFFFSGSLPTDDARLVAKQYFAQGHEINFVPVRDWILTTLSTIGPRCRAAFTEAFLALLGAQGVPSTLKVAWNDQVQGILG